MYESYAVIYNIFRKLKIPWYTRLTVNYANVNHLAFNVYKTCLALE